MADGRKADGRPRSSLPRATVIHRDGRLAARLQEHLNDVNECAVTFALRSAPFLAPDDESDVIVFDLSAVLPEGFVVQRVLQARSDMPPVLIARALAGGGDEDESRLRVVRGAEALEARLHTALGRIQHRSWLPLRFAGAHLTAQLPGTDVLVDGCRVPISPRESEILALLLNAPNLVVPRDVMMSEIWGYETRSLDVHIRRLRKKLGNAGRQIETAPGFGYRFVECSPADSSSPTPA